MIGVEFLLALLGTVLVNNFVLVQFLGLCPFMGVSNKLESAIGMGCATTFVLTLASLACYLAETYLLKPLDLAFLRTIAFIVVIASVVQFAKLFIEKYSPLLYRVLGVFLPLITTNCAVLGVTLQNTQQQLGWWQAGLQGFGAGLGFTLVLVLFSALRERISQANVPQAFRGAAIALMTAGIMSLAFMGFAGLVS
jgi:Na+-translocating ferredoxin:NAD+ oxidoreductase subunit A